MANSISIQQNGIFIIWGLNLRTELGVPPLLFTTEMINGII